MAYVGVKEVGKTRAGQGQSRNTFTEQGWVSGREQGRQAGALGGSCWLPGGGQAWRAQGGHWAGGHHHKLPAKTEALDQQMASASSIPWLQWSAGHTRAARLASLPPSSTTKTQGLLAELLARVSSEEGSFLGRLCLS